MIATTQTSDPKHKTSIKKLHMYRLGAASDIRDLRNLFLGLIVQELHFLLALFSRGHRFYNKDYMTLLRVNNTSCLNSFSFLLFLSWSHGQYSGISTDKKHKCFTET